MAIRIAINGFGRIGRNVLRSGWNNDEFEFVHINDLTSDDMLAYLLSHDSVHGEWEAAEAVEGGIRIGDAVIPTTAERDPSKLPWADANVDIVLECTGVFTDGNKARAHIEAGAKKVIISAPGKNVDGTFVMGVNDDELTADMTIVSNASCTTNCLAPLAKVLHEMGHALDFRRRRFPGLYALSRMVPGVALYQEYLASLYAIEYLREIGDQAEEITDATAAPENEC